jgi:hypothetical protein
MMGDLKFELVGHMLHWDSLRIVIAADSRDMGATDSWQRLAGAHKRFCGTPPSEFRTGAR